MTAPYPGDTSTRDIRVALSDPYRVAELLGLGKGAMRQAAGLLVRCPGHGDTDASLSLTRGQDGTLRVKCFGCDLSGDIYSLIAAAEGHVLPRDFPAVKARCAELAGMASDVRGEDVRAAPVKLPSLPDAEFHELAEFILRSGAIRRQWATGKYLDSRGLFEESVRDEWAALPTMRTLFAPTRRNAEACGLAREGSWVHSDNRLVIPWRGPDGKIQSLQRRRLDDGKPKYVFPPGRGPRWPYGVDRLVDDGLPVVLCEGAVDVLALRRILARRGKRAHVLGLPGVKGWRRDWASLGQGRPVVLALDNDSAGEAGCAEILADLGEASVTRWRPKGKDWADDLRRDYLWLVAR